MEWPLLASLPDEAREAVLRAARRRRFARGEVVFHEGDPADSLHLVLTGHVAVQVATPGGDRATLNVLGPGAHVGELALLPDRHERSATVTALDQAETLVLSASSFDQLRLAHPEVNEMLVLLLAERVRELSARLLEAMYDGLDRRLHRCLYRLGRVYVDGPGPVTIPMTQDQLSDLVGGTRPSVNQVLQRLVDEGVVELGRGRVVLHDIRTLRRKAAL
ncbi:Crp/Fnr family transcriptional regulator [Nocardioides marmoribigeumensis]|jgi:CRP-like cAMP-binding protein|uniref:CRP-like cAMP-binding protein n=1 Tax=Nocardioides marmoribigeumensis TaxID=433649 RepID=A0ABU2BQF8_9ACTN|nr:Crp/Fnr family transcriptional regulator [Nocardioides marmoribigeumensis]MDR7360875.1 CRP-like cAMP-binding protein [Nocardioides marmoribigeumensis]